MIPPGWTADLHKLAKGAAKDVQDILDLAMKSGGWIGKRTKKGHIALRHRGGGSTTLPTSPSDHRSMKNARRDIERGGNQ